MELIDVQKAIINLNNNRKFKELCQYYNRKSFFEILNVRDLERTHSDFLHWLFNMEERHELEHFATRRLLELAVIAKNELSCNTKAYFPDDIEDTIICGKYSISNHKCEKEKNNLDLFIPFVLKYENVKTNEKNEIKLCFIIENKVKAKEHNKQTENYFKRGIDNKEKDGTPIFIYLTPLSSRRLRSLSKPQCECEHFIQFNYQYLLDYVLEPCLKECSKESAKVFIEEYLRVLGKPAFENDKQNKKTGGLNIMATSSYEKELLREFWENNKDLFSVMFKTMTDEIDDEHLKPEVKEEISEILTAIENTKTGKGSTTSVVYKMYDNEEKTENGIEFLKDAVKQILEKNPNKIKDALSEKNLDFIQPEHPILYYTREENGNRIEYTAKLNSVTKITVSDGSDDIDVYIKTGKGNEIKIGAVENLVKYFYNEVVPKYVLEAKTQAKA